MSYIPNVSGMFLVSIYHLEIPHQPAVDAMYAMSSASGSALAHPAIPALPNPGVAPDSYSRRWGGRSPRAFPRTFLT